MNQFPNFHIEIDDALSQSARDLRRLAEFYRRHGKIEYADQVEQSLPSGQAQGEQAHSERAHGERVSVSPTPQAQGETHFSQFHWLHLPEKKVG